MSHAEDIFNHIFHPGPGRQALTKIEEVMRGGRVDMPEDIGDDKSDAGLDFMWGLAVGVLYPEYAKALYDLLVTEDDFGMAETARQVVIAAPLEVQG
ncbi:MAG: hypothetical protein Q8R28_15080 [Dehalococcoidia bacterium]|nr:hypothetical protein [Dehalococcoidia bacterium]